MDLNFDVINQKLVKNKEEFVVNKSDNYLKLFFNFTTNDWEDKTIFCLLKNSKRKTFQFYVKEDGVIVPDNVVDGKYFFVSLYGATEDCRITTNEIRIVLHRSGYTSNISSITGSTDVFIDLHNQIVAVDESISVVGKSGSYNDLTDVPEEFTPAEHTHNSSEITNINDTISVEIKQAYRLLETKIRTYGE